MPSFAHEAPLALLRDSPSLLITLIRDVIHAEVPAFAELRVAEADFTETTPVQRRADLVVTLHDAASRPIMGIICEVQRDIDRRKQFVWPSYAASLHGRIEAPVCLLVITDNEAVARWAAEPIYSLQAGSSFRPLVIGPAQIPRTASIEEAHDRPELAVLSAMAHGNREGGLDVVLTAIALLSRLPKPRCDVYFDYVWLLLSDATRKLVEMTMETRDSEYKSVFLSEVEGWGRRKGKAESVLAVLSARGFEVSEGLRERIQRERDPDRLDQLVRRAVTIDSVDDLFAGE